MSLFHKTEEPAGPVSFTDKESVIAILYLVVTADGTIAPEEEEMVIGTSNRMKLLRKQGIDDFNEAVWKVRTAIEAKGREPALAAALAGLPGELKETVYALAADIVFADGTAQAEENDFLRKVQEGLEVPDAFATKVLEVMRVKNGG